MICPKCNSEHVQVTTEQVSGKTKTRKRGSITNILYQMTRMFLCVCIVGFFMPKTLSNSKTKFKNATVAICQDCGYKWKV